MSQLDCVVYHTNSVKGKIVALTIEIESLDDESSNSNIDVNMKIQTTEGLS